MRVHNLTASTCFVRCAGMVLLATLCETPSGAITLAQALTATYQDNPQLTGQRAQLRATDEDAAIQRGAGRPQLGLQGNFTQGVRGLRALDGFNRAATASASASLPLYQGGRVRNAVQAADERVESGRGDLSAAEGDILLSAVTAYNDVLRDRAIVALNIDNVSVLQSDLDSSGQRFKAGDVTRTDVAQSAARLHGGQSQLAAARNMLLASEESFQRVTGLRPDALEPPPPLPALPATSEEAETIALNNNPALKAAAAAIKAAGYDTRSVRGGGLPTVSLSGSESYYRYLDRFEDTGNIQGDAAQVGVTVTVPLYQGGVLSAQVRKARDLESVAIEQKTQVERQVVANVHAAFSSYQTALMTIGADEQTVAANQQALAGVRSEAKAGFRQVLDVLNAQLELVNSQAALIGARRDAYVAAFQLLDAMGLADSKHLGMDGGALYDPTINYRNAVHRIGDFSDGSRPAPVAHEVYGPASPKPSPTGAPESNPPAS